MALYVGGTAIGATATEINNALDGMAQGDIVYASDADTPAQLTKGTDDYVLTMNGNVPNWEEAGGANFDAAITINDSGNDADFRVEGDDEEYLLFCDASEDRVGIGTATPAALLHIKSTTTDNRIQFENSASADSTTESGASIQHNSDHLYINVNESGGDVIFRTDGFAEKMRITSGGNVGIGTTDPGERFHMYNTSTENPKILIESTGIDDTNADNRGGEIQFYTSAEPTVNTYDPGSEPGRITWYCKEYTGNDPNAGDKTEIGRMYIFSRNQSGPDGRFIMLGRHVDEMKVLLVINEDGNTEIRGSLSENVSDERFKTNVVNISDALTKVHALNGVEFNWNDLAAGYGKDKTKDQVGLIAQEVQSVLSEAVRLAPLDKDVHNDTSVSGEDYLTIQYNKVIPLLVEAIKELSAKVEALENA